MGFWGSGTISNGTGRARLLDLSLLNFSIMRAGLCRVCGAASRSQTSAIRSLSARPDSATFRQLNQFGYGSHSHLCITWARWTLTVCSTVSRSPAICSFNLPATTYSSASRSRGVSVARRARLPAQKGHVGLRGETPNELYAGVIQRSISRPCQY
jgi:hypothetical protein